MKFLATIFLLILSGRALSQEPTAERFLITDAISAAIEDISENIKEAGLDPLQITQKDASFSLPVPTLFNVAAFCEDVLSTGLSDLVINHIHYEVLGFRLNFEIELPHFHLSVGAAGGEAEILGRKLSIEGSGRIDIYRIRVRGSVRISILGNITARAVNIDFTPGEISSNIKLNVLGVELSDLLNIFLGETIPQTLEAFKREVDELIEILLLDHLNENILPELQA